MLFSHAGRRVALVAANLTTVGCRHGGDAHGDDR
jgi:hypothetical protein